MQGSQSCAGVLCVCCAYQSNSFCQGKTCLLSAEGFIRRGSVLVCAAGTEIQKQQHLTLAKIKRWFF